MTSLAQPFVYKGLSLFMCVGWSRRMGLSHFCGLAVGLFYPLDIRLWILCSVVVGLFLVYLRFQMHRQLLFPTCAVSASYPPLPDACSDTGGSRCSVWSVSFRDLSVRIWAVERILSWWDSWRGSVGYRGYESFSLRFFCKPVSLHCWYKIW